LFNMELKAMNEMAQSDELVDAKIHTKTIITQYLQDLYRFFKLHPIKYEFEDIFTWDYDLINSYFFNHLIEDEKIIRNIGEFYFEKDYYTQAIKIFENLPEKALAYEVYEKTAYSYQQLGNYTKALENYLKAELYDKNRAWIVKKIAYCYRKLRDYKKSVEYYLEALQLEPENLYILTYLGHTYMDMEDFETALQYYFKVEYLAPDNHKIQRPIAWCSFVLGKFDVAQKYFNKLIGKEANQNDFLNLGHVLFCLGDKKEAIEHYKLSLRKAEMNEAWFRNEFGNDSQYLIKHGINSLDISLMQDYVLISV
jgi:tetratricopeptide (TPR) repeat protein